MKLHKAGRLAATAVLVFGAVACSGDTPADPTVEETTSQISADPMEAVTTAIAGITEESYTLHLAMGDLLTATGVADPLSSSAHFTVSASNVSKGLDLTYETIAIGDDVWITIGGSAAESMASGVTDGWFHTTADAEELQEIDQLDPAGFIAGLDGMVKTATERGEQIYDVTLDAAGFSGALGNSIDATELAAVITLTDAGRLQTMEITFPEAIDATDQVVVLTYSAHGEPVVVEAPHTADVKELSEVMEGGF